MVYAPPPGINALTALDWLGDAVDAGLVREASDERDDLLPGALKRTGTTAGILPDMLTHGELWDLFGREEWSGLERRFVRDVGPGKGG
jgi:hypothetical protein